MNRHLQCPTCGAVGEIVFTSMSGDIHKTACASCNREIAVYNGIPDFAEHVPLKDPNLGPAQKLMNSRCFALAYESPIWRPLHTYIGSGLTMSAEVRQVLKIANTDRANIIVDLACGTGHYARAFANAMPGAEVYGVDISLGMLARAKTLARRKALEHVIFLRGDIFQLPFDDRSVDWIHCGGALHLFPDLGTIWEEIARVVKPGGVFTAMTIALVNGIIGKWQQRIMNRGRATFFQPGRLAADLNAVHLSSFHYQQHRIILLFSVVKEAEKMATSRV